MIKTADLTPRQRKLAITAVAVVLVYLLFGFVGAPFIVRRVLEKQAAAAIGRQVAVGSVRVNPITLSVTLRQLDIREPGGAPFVRLDEGYVNLQTVSLFKRALVLKSIRLVNPQVSLVRSGERTFNFSDIGAGESDRAAAPATDTTTGGMALAIYELVIEGGRIAVDDQVAGVSHSIEALNLDLADFSSRPADVDVYTRCRLSARINGADVSLKGKSRPFASDRASTADIDIEGLAVPHYLPYIPLPAGLALRSLNLDLHPSIELRLQDGGDAKLTVAGALALRDIKVAGSDGEPLFNQSALRAELMPSTPLDGRIRLAQVDLDRPELFLQRLASGAFNIPFAASDGGRSEPAAADDDPPKGAASAPVITVDQFNLIDGVVHFTDRSNRSVFSTTITDLDLTVDNAGFNSDRTAGYRLSLATAADEAVAVQGTASLTPLAATGEVTVSRIQPARYAPYYQDRFGFQTTGGTVSLGGHFRFAQDTDIPRITLAGVHLDVDGLAVAEQGERGPLFSLTRLRLGDTTADLAQRTVTLGRLDLSGGKIHCLREKNGTLNLVRAFTPTPAPSDADMPSPAKAVDAPSAKTEPPADPLVVNIKAIAIDDISVAVEDRTPAEPARFQLDGLRLTASDLSTAQGQAGTAELALRWEQGGAIKAGGRVTLDPLDLDLALNIKEMDVRPFQPYLSQQAGLIVTSGFFATKGRLRLQSAAGASPTVTYGGRIGLDRFASIDRKHANDFLKWQSLAFEKVDFGVNPGRLAIDQIALTDFFARVIVDADGSLNLVSMFAPPAAEPSSATATASADNAASAPPGGEPAIRIARVTLKGGDVDFSDRFIKPNFNASFSGLAGQISGLESIAERHADVRLDGIWANQAPLSVTGAINPLIADPYVDLNLKISDIELSPFSPYSGKYLGYILDKGKLTFNVAYRLQNRQLEAKNSIYIDQLTLGDAVQSPQAVNLPIKLAVALLKDREGNIMLDLPVSGDLDDPQFRIGRVVLTVLKNLIVKIVSSPFAVLGNMVGGGEELRYLDFNGGASGIGTQNAEKLDKLAKILYERPGLKLDIQGVATPRGDMAALQANLLENRLKAEKLRQMVKAGKRAVPLDELHMSPEERTAILEAAFTADGIAAPVDASGAPIALTPAIMADLLREKIAVSDDDYQRLADARAFNARNYLIENGRVEQERVFIVAPRIGAEPSAAEGAGGGRVIFSLH